MADDNVSDDQPIGEVEDPEQQVITPAPGAEDKSDVEIMGEDDKTPATDDKKEDEKEEEKEPEKVEPTEEEKEAAKVAKQEEKEAKRLEKEAKEKEEDEKADAEDAPLPGRPSYREIKEAYPTIFQKFPGLRDSIFREQRYAETFATVEEAQRAASKADNFDLIDASLSQGDPELLLKELGEGNKESFKKVTANFLPTLQKLDREAYIQATFPVLEDLIRAAYNDGKSTNDKNLMFAAGHLAKFVFGEAKIPEPRVDRGPHPAEVQLKEERTRHFQERHRAFDEELGKEAGEELNKLATTGIADPEKKLSGYVRKAIARDTIAQLDAELMKDERLKTTLNRLWKSAAQGGFTREHKASILGAHLARAKQLLPGIRNRLVSEALNQAPPAPRAAVPPAKQPEKRVLPDSGVGKPSGGPRPYTAKDVDWSKTSDLDILNDKPTLRKR